ncbi:MAG: right-handed parallel beta-helix repeat-containing protein [Candidatus Dojkabacteria bacterium]|nr:right-handed parallel beta-helix repeat-containing protein [Candidatus Dojkabacteria bacterium]
MRRSKKIIPAILIVFGMFATALAAYYIQYQQEIRSGAAVPETIYVRQTCDPTDPNCAVTVNYALGRVEDGWTIIIEIPVYDDMAIISPDYLNPDLLDGNPHNFNIQGKGTSQTTWVMTKPNVGNGHAVHIEKLDNITINFSGIKFDAKTFANSTVHIYGTNTDGTADPNANTSCTINFTDVVVQNSKAAGIYYSGNNGGTVKTSTFENNEWPGVSVHGSAKVDIEESTFKNHQHQAVDAKDSPVDAKDSPEVNVDKCTFEGNNIKWEDADSEDNKYGALQYFHNSKGTIKNSQFLNNLYTQIRIGKGYIGAITDNCNVNIYNNTLSSSQNGSGIAYYGTSTGSVLNNILKNNKVDGILLNNETSALIKNNIIINNGSEGIDLYDRASSQIINNTILGNLRHGIDLFDDATATVLNNISAFNADGGIRAAAQSNFTALEYNIAFGNTGGDWNDFSNWPPATNLTVDPMFVDKDGGDYHLQTGSPAINAGHPDAQYNDPDGSRNDIGAYGGPLACGLDPDLPGCESPCTPQCEGKECGDDGCNGTCPPGCTNNHGTTQCSTGLCTPTCDADWGNCDSNNANGCETDLRTSNANCGVCGNACGTGQICQNSTCTTGPACSTDEDCKPDCSGAKRAPYSCDTALGTCIFGDPLVCDKECGAECVTNDDCDLLEICDTENCTCAIPPIKCSQNSDCDDDNECTSNTCDTLTGICSYLPVSDGTDCSTCTSGNCECIVGVCSDKSPTGCDIADIFGEEGKPDGHVNSYDLSRMLSNWKWQKTPRDKNADIWGPLAKSDGEVNAWDLSKLLGCFERH